MVAGEVLGLRIRHEGLHVLQQAHRAGGGGHAMHGAAEQADAAAVRLGRADHAVHPRDVGGETADRHLALQGARSARSASIAHHRPPTLPSRPGTRWCCRTPWPGRPRRRGGELGPTSVGAPDHRVGVDLPVAGVQDHTQRRADRHAVRLGDRVGQRDQLDVERDRASSAARQRHLGDLDLVEQVLVAQLLAQQEGGERAWRRPAPCRRGHSQPTAPMWSSWAWVRTMPTMSSRIFLEIGRVGGDDLDPRRGLIAEGDAEIDHQPLACSREARKP